MEVMEWKGSRNSQNVMLFWSVLISLALRPRNYMPNPHTPDGAQRSDNPNDHSLQPQFIFIKGHNSLVAGFDVLVYFCPSY